MKSKRDTRWAEAGAGLIIFLLSSSLWALSFRYSLIGHFHTEKYSPGFSVYNGSLALWLDFKQTSKTQLDFREITFLIDGQDGGNRMLKFGRFAFNEGGSYTGDIALPWWVFSVLGLACVAIPLIVKRSDEVVDPDP